MRKVISLFLSLVLCAALCAAPIRAAQIITEPEDEMSIQITANPAVNSDGAAAPAVNSDGAANPPAVSSDGTANPPAVSSDGTANPPAVSSDGAANPPAVSSDGTANPPAVSSDGTANPPAVNSDPDGLLPFSDVPPEHWAYTFVHYTYAHHLFNGTTPTTFSPTASMTRAMFVTVLYRLAAERGEDMALSGGASPFTDIADSNAEFQRAIQWAAEHGIVNGVTETTFEPRRDVTRQQMCAIMIRYLRDYLRYDLSPYASNQPSPFADSGTFSSYAAEAISLAYAMGLISGRSGADGAALFAPADSASRAAVSKVIALMAQKIPELSPLPQPEPDGNPIAADSGGNPILVDSSGNPLQVDSGGNPVLTLTPSATPAAASSNTGGVGGSGGGGGGGGGGASGGKTATPTPTATPLPATLTPTPIPTNTLTPTPSSAPTSTPTNAPTSTPTNTPTSTPTNTPTPLPTHTDEEKAEEERAVAYMDDVVRTYDVRKEYIPASRAAVRECLDVLMETVRRAVTEHNQGVFIDQNYVQNEYASEIADFRDRYDALSDEERNYAINFVMNLGESYRLRTIQRYFGVSSSIFS